MENIFDRMRLRHITAGAGVIGAAAAAGQVGAAVVGTGFNVDTGGVIYSSIKNYSATSSSSLPGPIGDNVYGIVDATTANGGDAFDVFAGIAVNGVSFNQPGGVVDLTTTGEGTFVTTITPMDIDGVNVSLDYFMDASSSTLRIFATFENTDSTGTVVSVAYGGNLGSDGGTQIDGSSNGDNIFDLATDRWVITSDNDEDTDPVLTHVRFGPDGQAPSSTPAAFGTNGTNVDFDLDVFADIWDLSLDSGETQSLMMFVNLNPSVSEAQSGTGVFDSLLTLNGDGLLAGLTSTQVAQTVNWSEPPPSTTVAEPGILSLMGIALLGVVVTRFIRR